MSSNERRRPAAGRPVAVEVLETRRLLSGQWFAGEGPVVRRDARTVITADLNQDGYLDVATPSAFGTGSSSMQVFVDLGDGAGGFESAAYPGPTQSTTVSAGAAGDFNGDGLADLALARSSGIAVLAGDGTGQFKALTSVAMSASGATSILVADLNADGRLDLVAPSSSGVVSVALGNGNATFATPVTYAAGSSAAAVVGGDFNGDGRLDLAVANAAVNGTVSVLLGDGAGGFGAATQFATGSRPMSLVTGDFNADGKADLATANFAGNGVSVLGGNGDGTFAPAVTTSVGTSPQSLAAADFDGDGRTDLAVANSTSNTLSVLTQSAAGTLAVSATIATGVAPYAVVAADFNGDARPDLLIANNGEVVDSVFLNSGTGTFAPSVASTNAVGTKPMAAAAGDFDGDGDTDMVVANAGSNSVSYLAGQGNGTFAAAVSLAVGTSPYAVVAADFNGDGKLDVAAANYGSNTVSLLLGQGDGNFAAPVAVAVGTNPTSMTSADYNGDGRADLVVANSGMPPSGSPSLTVLLGTAAGGFVRSNIALGSTSQPYYAVTGDFNGDGKPDVAVSMRMGSNAAIATLLNTGSGFNGINASISLPGLIPSTTEYLWYQTVAVDFNGDGRDDLGVCLPTDLYLTTLVSNPNGSFTTTYFGAMTANGALSLAAADLDADGTKEIIAASPSWPTGGALSLFKTELFLTTTGQATLAMDSTAVAVAGSPYAVTAADFNGDGRPDVASVNSDGTVAVLLNRYRANPYVTRTGDTLTVAAPGPRATNVRVDVPTNGDLVRLTVDTPVGRETFWTNALRHLVLSGANVVVKSDLRALPGLQTVTVPEAAAVTFAASQHLGALDVRGTAGLAAGGEKVLRVAGLTIEGGGRLDLADNALLYDYAADAGQTAAVRALIAAGRAGGTWAGPGLTSSAARDRIGGTTLGLMTAAEYRALRGTAATFAGETLDDTAVLVQYTLAGDTDFDRRVDFNDFLRVQAAFGQTNTTSAGGDFDFDGDTDFNDFLALQTNFGQSLPAATPPVAPAAKKSTVRVSAGK